MRRSVLDILDTVKFIFGNLGELQCWLATVAGLQLEPEHRRKTTFARSLQQSLAQAEAGAGQQSDRGGMGLEEGLQYVIVTNAENPVWVFSFRWSGISTCHHPCPCDCCRDWEVAGRLQVPVPRLGEDRVRDTIGAGDSFIAGFLHSASAQPDLGAAVCAGVGGASWAAVT